MKLYKIEHMYFPFSAIIDFLLNADHFSSLYFELLTFEFEERIK